MEAHEDFEHPLYVSLLNHRLNSFEERWITIGIAGDQGIVVAVHLYFDAQEVVRIMSARYESLVNAALRDYVRARTVE